MNRNTPAEIILNERLFVIDTAVKQFVQQDEPRHKIPFSHLKDQGSHYALDFDALQNRVVPTSAPRELCQIKQLQIPKALLSPDFKPDLHYAGLYNQNSRENDWGTLLIDLPIAARLKGTLPELDINGNRWYIDLAFHELVLKTNTDHRIDLRELWTSEGQQHLRCFFDARKQEMVALSPELAEKNNNIVLLEFPQPMALDPIGYAREYNLHDFSLLLQHPQRSVHQAVLTEVPIREQISYNFNRQMIERELPAYDIEGTLFLVDVVNKELRQLDDPSNTISFLHMKEDGQFYNFHYDTELRKMAGYATFLQKQGDLSHARSFSAEFLSTLDARYQQEMKENIVTIPQMVILDPEGMAFHYKVPLAEIHHKTDFELLVDQALYQDRISGNLPAIDLLGHPYYVDLHSDELRPKEYPELPSIPLASLERIDDLENLGFLYEPKTGRIPEQEFIALNGIPKDCRYLRIPAISKLDPVGYARKLGLNVRDFLRQQPITHRLKAEVADWNETRYIRAILADQSGFAAEYIQPKLKKSRKKKGKGI